VTPVKYPLAERFHEVQGEGQFVGTRMAFVRMVGCSVGQKVCTACDTDFDRMRPELGGGTYTADELVAYAKPVGRMCITGGEPLDRDIRPLLLAATAAGVTCHVETSGTQLPAWLTAGQWGSGNRVHYVDGKLVRMWLCVSPKPGYTNEMVVEHADEVKVIVGGLGDGPGWPTVEQAAAWANLGQLVYIQPRNHTKAVNEDNLAAVLALTEKYPRLRVSCQLHKFLGVR